MISLTINDSRNSMVPAIIDTGANCSCINTEFRNQYFPEIKLQKLRTGNVNQASGGSIGAIGTIEIICKIKNRLFNHRFIVCSALKAQMILGLDFVQTYRIGIDWDDNMEPYLQSEGRYLTSAMPLQSLSLDNMLNTIQKAGRNNGDAETPNPSVSCKPKLMLRLLSKTQIRLPPKTVVPVKQKEPQGTVKMKNMDIMGYESFYLEHPNISVVPTTHIKLNKNMVKHLILLLLNTVEEEVVIQKSCTIALGVKSRWKTKWGARVMRHNVPSHVQRQLNKLTMQSGKEDTGPSVQRALEETTFVGRHNTYTKSKVTLKDVTLTPILQKRFENLKEKYKDIFLIGLLDIGITALAEMTIDTREDAIPYAARLYKLALQHQDFLR